jgi:hypothetical protein
MIYVDKMLLYRHERQANGHIILVKCVVLEKISPFPDIRLQDHSPF